jgi:hypothetical protein
MYSKVVNLMPIITRTLLQSPGIVPVEVGMTVTVVHVPITVVHVITVTRVLVTEITAIGIAVDITVTLVHKASGLEITVACVE